MKDPFLPPDSFRVVFLQSIFHKNFLFSFSSVMNKIYEFLYI